MTTYHLPKDVLKFCPRCGSKAFEFQGQKSFQCKQCDFVFYMNAASAVAALILDEKNRLLFARRAFEPHKGTLDLPGGFVDHDESVEHALCREIKEELNLEVDSYRFYKSYPNRYTFKGLTYHTADMFFTCTIKNHDLMEARDDAAEAVILPLDKINMEEIGLTSIRKVVGEFIRENGKK